MEESRTYTTEGTLVEGRGGHEDGGREDRDQSEEVHLGLWLAGPKEGERASGDGPWGMEVKRERKRERITRIGG